MVLAIASHWQGWLEWSGSSLAGLITAVAALIASLAAWRRVRMNERDQNKDCDKN